MTNPHINALTHEINELSAAITKSKIGQVDRALLSEHMVRLYVAEHTLRDLFGEGEVGQAAPVAPEITKAPDEPAIVEPAPLTPEAVAEWLGDELDDLELCLDEEETSALVNGLPRVAAPKLRAILDAREEADGEA